MSSLLHVSAVEAGIKERLLTEFHRAAGQVAAYRILLAECGVRADDVTDVDSFLRLCPWLDKRNTFGRFPVRDLRVEGPMATVAEVLTSSGHGGRFSFGIVSREEAAASAGFIDLAMDAAFGVASRSTLAINCLPMGVVFSSRCMTVATISVREDMAVALAEAVGSQFEQMLLVGDPLFLKRLTDYAAEIGFDWRRFRVKAVLGEEMFGEQFRGYLADCFGMGEDDLEQGAIVSSFGVAELGLHLCFETPATVALRRAAAGHAEFARALLGGGEPGQPLPMIFAFNPERIFIEVIEPDRSGYGKLAMSMLDPSRSVPLLRYQTGDVGRLLDRDHVEGVIRRHGGYSGGGDDLPPTMVALEGRDSEVLPNGSHVGVYKDALYVDHQLARRLSGAFRVNVRSGRVTMHVQLARGEAPSAEREEKLLAAIDSRVRPDRLVLWPYAAFPYGMGLDYQRKFSSYLPGETDA